MFPLNRAIRVYSCVPRRSFAKGGDSRADVFPCKSGEDCSRLGGVWNLGSGQEAASRQFSFPFFRLAVLRVNSTGRKRKNHNMHQQIKLIRLIVPVVACFGLAPVAQAVGPDTEGVIPGSNNGEGVGVLVSRTNGIWNTGTGFQALNHLTAGNQNTATGLRALFSDVSGGYNTATGVYSLYSNTVGFFNSATGAYSLANNTIGDNNTANGYSALYFNTEGDVNTATGYGALYKNTTGGGNTANGYAALFNNMTGNSNTANGYLALLVSTGHLNTAIGAGALGGVTTGSGNIALGVNAGSAITANNNVICIGAPGPATVSDACFIGHIFGTTSSGGTAVFINSDGRLGTTTSSRRFKEEIKTMELSSEALYALKPVTFRYKKEFDPQGILQFGLVAEDVEAVNPDLVVRDKEGKPYSVRYDQVNAMLLNEVLKEHKKVEAQQTNITQLNSKMASQAAIIAQQQKGMEALTAQLKEQAAQIQKVSAQLEVSKPAPQVASHEK
jgi:trimeric autotransporter adhesin